MNQNIPVEPTNSMNTVEPVKKQRSFWKNCFIIVGIILLIIITVVIVQIIRIKTAKDIAPINDSDLQLSPVKVADSENAYFDIVKIQDVYFPEGFDRIKALSGENWDENQIKEIIAKNQENLNYFDQALKKPIFQDPTYTDPTKVTAETSSGTPYNKLRSISQVKLLQAELNSRAKEFKSLDEAISVAEIGDKLQKSQHPLIVYLVSLALKKLSLEEIEQIVKSGNFTPAEIKNYASRVENIKPSRQGWETALKYEYITMTNTIDNLMAEALEEGPDLGTEIKAAAGQEGLVKLMNSNFYFQKNDTKRLYAEWAREEISLTSKSCEDINNYKPKENKTSFSPITFIFKENAIGYTLTNITTVSLSGIGKRICDQEILAEKVITEMNQ